MGKGGCAGIMTLFGPPTLLGFCYVVWERGCGRAAMMHQSAATYASGLAALVGAYRAQSLLVFRHFDAAGAESWRNTVDALGEPLKVQTWSQFYKLAGPPVICLLYTSPSPRDGLLSRMPSSA